MTQLDLHPSVTLEKLREAMVYAESAIFASAYGQSLQSKDQAAVVIRQIIEDIDRQTA